MQTFGNLCVPVSEGPSQLASSNPRGKSNKGEKLCHTGNWNMKELIHPEIIFQESNTFPFQFSSNNNKYFKKSGHVMHSVFCLLTSHYMALSKTDEINYFFLFLTSQTIVSVSAMQTLGLEYHGVLWYHQWLNLETMVSSVQIRTCQVKSHSFSCPTIEEPRILTFTFSQPRQMGDYFCLFKILFRSPQFG